MQRGFQHLLPCKMQSVVIEMKVVLKLQKTHQTTVPLTPVYNNSRWQHEPPKIAGPCARIVPRFFFLITRFRYPENMTERTVLRLHASAPSGEDIWTQWKHVLVTSPMEKCLYCTNILTDMLIGLRRATEGPGKASSIQQKKQHATRPVGLPRRGNKVHKSQLQAIQEPSD